MKKKKKEDWNLKAARNILEETIQNPDNYFMPRNMSKVCEMLESYCRKHSNKKQADHFKGMNKLFMQFDKRNKKTLGRLSVLAEPERDFIMDSSKEFKTFIEIVDLEKYKGEKCICTYRRDGTVDIQFYTITINIPKKKFELWEEQKK